MLCIFSEDKKFDQHQICKLSLNVSKMTAYHTMKDVKNSI